MDIFPHIPGADGLLINLILLELVWTSPNGPVIVFGGF
jgi:hypothetical protein